MVHQEWKNWSGSLRFRPGQQVFPESEQQVAQLVQQAAAAKTRVRTVGAGHSSSALVQTDAMLLSLRHLQGLVAYDPQKNEATIRSGMRVHDAGQDLLQVGLAMHNTGDVDVQMVAGAIATGTHGSGRQLQNLATMLIGARLVTATGQVIDKHQEQDPAFIRALRVSLGALGICTELRLKLLPAFRMQRREYYTHIDACLHHLDELIARNRNFDFYWYPRSDQAKIRILNPPGQGDQDLAYARRDKHMEGWSGEVLPRTRELRFDEMEYALPAEAGPACFGEVRQRIKARHRRQVAWRVMYRTVAADDAFLSPHYGRDSVTISLHHNAGLPFEDYFNDMEPVFRAYGGRPHWGKKHNLKAKDLAPLYPELSRFLEIRKTMDPEGIFLNDHLKQLLGLD